jgi:3',5'-cyclic AMP phosphodiesterase CpdA
VRSYQTRGAGTGEDQALNIRRRELLTVLRRQGHRDVEPALARWRDLEPRLQSLKVLRGALLEPFLKGHLPLPLPAWIIAREKTHHRPLPVQIPTALRVRSSETGGTHPLPSRELRTEVASRVARGAFRIRQPEGLVLGGHTHGHDARPIGALQLRLDLRQPALKSQDEARRLRFQGELIESEIRVHLAFRLEHDQFLAEEKRHALPREFQRGTKQIMPLLRQPYPVQRIPPKRPECLAPDERRRTHFWR